MTAAQVHWLFKELLAVSGHDGCKLEDVGTQGAATRIVWSRQGGRLPPALVAPRGCLVSPDLDGVELQARVPSSVRTSCPTSYARLSKLVGHRVGMLVPSATGGLARAYAVALTVPVFALALLLLLWMGVRRLRHPQPLGAEQRRWLLLGVAAFLLALLVRLSVTPALANWYAIVLPASGTIGGRFGPGGLIFQRVLSLLFPWSDRTLFVADAVLGAAAVAFVVGIARERRLPVGAAGALVVLFALAPLHVRISASPSEHVLASTLTLAGLWAWLRAQRFDSRAGALLALLLLAGAVMTRAEFWVQIVAIAAWGILRDPVEQAPAPPRRWRFAAVFAATWLLVGVAAYFTIVVPSHQPGPAIEGMQRAARQLVAQYADVAFSPPHWVSPLAVVLALPGLGYLLVRRWRLLAGILLFLVLAFVPLGRTLQHDGLLGARYFLATLPLFLMLPACGIYVCGRGIVWGLRRVPRLADAARVEQAVTMLLLFAVALGDLALVAPAYRARYTFQDEYRFLRGALARVPAGCLVASLPVRSTRYGRDLDCCLDIEKSPLSIAYPKLRFAVLRHPGDLEGPGCRYYYQSAACSIDLPQAEIAPVDRRALDFLRRACREVSKARLSPVAGARVSPRSTNGYFGRRAPEVRLFRVGSAPGAPPEK